jgi:hypothetical protein
VLPLSKGVFAMLRLFLLPAFLAAFATAAAAQTIEIRSNPQSSGSMGAEPVRITLGVSMFLPALSGNSEEALKVQEAARRMIYDIAAHECGILRDMLAGECRLDSINVNAQRSSNNQFGAQQRSEGFNINGNVSLRVVPK